LYFLLLSSVVGEVFCLSKIFLFFFAVSLLLSWLLQSVLLDIHPRIRSGLHRQRVATIVESSSVMNGAVEPVKDAESVSGKAEENKEESEEEDEKKCWSWQ